VYEALLRGEFAKDGSMERADFAVFLALMYARTTAMRRMSAEMRGRDIQIMPTFPLPVPPYRRPDQGIRFAHDLYGTFPVKRFFVRSGKGRSSSRRLRSGSRSARKGSRDRNASAAWRRAALASLVFRSALTPEHAEGR